MQETAPTPVDDRLKNREALKTSGRVFAQYPGKLLGIAFIYFVFFALAEFVFFLLAGKLTFLEDYVSRDQLNDARIPIVIFLCVLLLSLFIMQHTILRGFILATNEKRKLLFSDFFMMNKNVFIALFTTILQAIILTITLAAFIGVGYLFRTNDTMVLICSALAISSLFTLAITTTYAVFYTLDKGINPVKAIGYSFVDVSRETSYVLVSVALGVAITLFAGMLFVLPLLAAIPFVYIYRSIVYRRISHHRAKKNREMFTKSTNDAVVSQDSQEFFGSQAHKDFEDIINNRSLHDH